MMKRTIIVITIFLSILSVGSVYAETISNQTKSQLIEIKDNELKSMEDYQQAYGNTT